jgi:anti-sigma factor ChrR (cupin superfamily)
MDTNATKPGTGNLATHFRDPATMEWTPTKFPGIRIKLLYEDKATGLFTALFDWAPGASLPYHEHIELEQTFVLEGTLEDDEVKAHAGQYVARPPGSRHIARTKDGCRIIAFFLKPNVFIGAGGEMEAFSTAPSAQ